MVQWVGDSMEIVSADSSFSIASVEADTWSHGDTRCFSGQAIDVDFLKVADFGIQPIQMVGFTRSS